REMPGIFAPLRSEDNRHIAARGYKRFAATRLSPRDCSSEHKPEDAGQLLGPVSRRSVSLWLLNPILDLPASSPELSKTSTVAARLPALRMLGSSTNLTLARISVRLPPA